MQVIDAHTHVGGCMSTAFFTDHKYSVDELLKEMDNSDVVSALVSGGGQPHMIKNMNRDALHSTLRCPERLHGLIRIHPKLPDWEDEVDRYMSTGQFKGIKLHPAQDAYLAIDPTVDQVIAKAEELGVPVLVHSGTEPYTSPGLIAKLAANHPKAAIIMAHAGRGEAKGVLATAENLSNLYLECSMNLPSNVRRAIDRLGPERIMYGSNWPACGMRPWIETMRSCMEAFSSREYDLFMGGNAARLFRLETLPG